MSFKLLYYSQELYQSTVSTKLLDQSENIVAAEESMLIESLGHYYTKHRELAMITRSAWSVVFQEAVTLSLYSWSTDRLPSSPGFLIGVKSG